MTTIREGEVVEVRNKRVLFKDFLKGVPGEEDFIHEETSVKLDVEAGSKDVLLKTLYLSMDPYMRGRMTGDEKSYVPPFTPGDVVTGLAVAQVVKSDNPKFKVGEYVYGTSGWEEYHLVKGGDAIMLDCVPFKDLPLSYNLSILGMPSFTAWTGFFEAVTPKPGHKVFVSSAAGAVGQMVGQFAKLTGCYVVGSAGTDDKVKLLKEKLGFDAAFNYKKEDDLEAALRRHFPEGIDIYFDNVGGKMLDAVLKVINWYGQISVCGMISQYNLDDSPQPLYNLGEVFPKRLKIQGFIILDYTHLRPKFEEFVSTNLRQKKLVCLEDFVDGIQNAPAALIGLFQGKNVGKQIVRVASE
eukprot:TRINITY_DN15957_c0_g1_i1.p1 TRINITY_DN15957_c0_g1~~TRINITY_DN15957_c0_g1_i1.p1  ORF type:complete len:354 (+),score=70.08 TRINITY_DN15957_c0_g1_i1:105-1166(+)